MLDIYRIHYTLDYPEAIDYRTADWAWFGNSYMDIVELLYAQCLITRNEYFDYRKRLHIISTKKHILAQAHLLGIDLTNALHFNENSSDIIMKELVDVKTIKFIDITYPEYLNMFNTDITVYELSFYSDNTTERPDIIYGTAGHVLYWLREVTRKQCEEAGIHIKEISLDEYCKLYPPKKRTNYSLLDINGNNILNYYDNLEDSSDDCCDSGDYVYFAGTEHDEITYMDYVHKFQKDVIK